MDLSDMLCKYYPLRCLTYNFVHVVFYYRNYEIFY